MTGGLEVDVSVRRRHFDVLATMSIEPGERVALFGPSGAGKTTLLETISGLVDPSSGSVRLGETVLSRPPAGGAGGPGGPGGADADGGGGGAGGAVAKRAGRLGRRMGGRHAPAPGAVAHASLVRQPTALFPHLDVEANVSYGNTNPRIVSDVLEGIGLGALRRARPSSLSGGQAQRVSLARALARNYSVLLLDEPMSGIDAATRSLCWELVERRCADEDAIALLVTHDLREAQAFGDRIAVMDEGEILQIGDPHEVVAAPVSRRAAEVLGYVSWLKMRRVSRTAAPSEPVEIEVALEPGRLLPGSFPGKAVVLSGTVTACQPAGAGYELTVSVAAGSPLLVPYGGEWVTAVTCTVAILLYEPSPVGKEVTATALNPPVVASSTGTDATQAGRHP